MTEVRSVREIRLNGRNDQFVALVDDEDYESLSQYKWHRTTCGYAARTMYDKETGKMPKVWMHRVIMDPPPGLVVDHINGDQLDNRRANLRVVTQRENCQNRRYGFGKSRYRGVALTANGKWRASVKLDGRRHHVGIFDDEHDAGEAARAWRIENVGPHAA